MFRVVCEMKHELGSCFLNGRRLQQNWSRIQQNYMQETQLTPDELAVVK